MNFETRTNEKTTSSSRRNSIDSNKSGGGNDGLRPGTPPHDLFRAAFEAGKTAGVADGLGDGSGGTTMMSTMSTVQELIAQVKTDSKSELGIVHQDEDRRQKIDESIASMEATLRSREKDNFDWCLGSVEDLKGWFNEVTADVCRYSSEFARLEQLYNCTEFSEIRANLDKRINKKLAIRGSDQPVSFFSLREKASFSDNSTKGRGGFVTRTFLLVEVQARSASPGRVDILSGRARLSTGFPSPHPAVGKE